MTREVGVNGSLDGNAAAGAMARLFGRDITDAMGTCIRCHHRGAIAETRAYLDAPGVVLRCPGCDTVLMRWTVTPAATWLEMTGLLSIEIAGGSALHTRDGAEEDTTASRGG